MRVEPFGVGSVVHAIKRGARGMEIVRDESDQWRFAKNLFILNDEYQSDNVGRDIEGLPFADRPEHWPERDPLVAILAWTLMPNHFHLLLLEIKQGGIAKFLQRICGSMSAGFNEKYKERGSIFQGPYKSRTIDTDRYLNQVIPYIAVKNVLELYPRGGLRGALKEFDKAWKWAETYPFSSFQTHALSAHSPIIDIGRLQEFGLPTGNVFKQMAHEVLLVHTHSKADIPEFMLEEW